MKGVIVMSTNLPSQIDQSLGKVIEAIALPAATEVGLILQNAVKRKRLKSDHEVNKDTKWYDAQLKKFEEQLNDGFSKIPDDYFQEPKVSCVTKISDTFRHVFDEAELRDMFLKLILSSYDSRKSPKIHPSFFEIIKQLSPLDAQNLTLFKSFPELPIAQYEAKYKSGGKKDIKPLVFLSNPINQDIETQAVSMITLNRLGLLDISYTNHFVSDKAYELFDNDPTFISLVEFYSNLPEYERAVYSKGQASITALGEAFITICLP